MAKNDRIRTALAEALAARGLSVGSDTLGARGELYVRGSGDLAAALFELHASARDAIDAMYGGAWVEGLPPRFAVLPADSAQETAFELLEQMRIAPLLYSIHGDVVRFPDLDRVLAEAL